MWKFQSQLFASSLLALSVAASACGDDPASPPASDVTPGPCEGIVCDTPPSPCHAPVGLCEAGVCAYAVLEGLPCDDGDACTESDSCQADASCAGAAIACQTPPPARCDGDDLIVYTSVATCSDGTCDYASQIVPCEEGCEDDRCAGDPCAGITCDTPPSGCHEAVGTCRDGVCDYAHDDGATCEDGDACTTGDGCQSGVCAGAPVRCDAPPTPSCKDGDTLVRWAAAGTCAGGECAYTSEEVACEFGCVTEGSRGACAGDPCGFVTCDAPPAPRCDGDARIVAAAAGTCADGDCSYAETSESCPHGCEAGVCQAPVGLVIAEIAYDTDGFPDVDSFVEIAGPAGTELAGLSLVGVNGNGGADYGAIPLTGVISEGGRYLVAHPLGRYADTADLLDTDVDYQQGPDSVQLRYGTVVVDAIAYGTFTGASVAAGEGEPAPTAGVGFSLSRDRDDTDTDDNAADFRAVGSTPGGPAFWPEVAPEIALSCPGGGAPGETLTFTATAEAGDIATWAFEFGDGETADGAAEVSHAYATEGTFAVRVVATTAGGQTDEANCQVVIAATETPALHTGEERCFVSESYLYEVISNPEPPTTDARLTLRFKGISQYGVNGYSLQLEVGPNVWSAVASTVPSKTEWQTQTFTIAREDLQAAIDTMGWIRFRWSYLTNGGSGQCMQVSLAYNCTSCFLCPPGEEDLGLGCQPTDVPYDYTALEHPRGLCATSSRDAIYLPATPAPTGDGTLTVRSLGCGSGTASVRMYTQNAGWVDIGSGSAGNCYFGSSTWTIPQAYLAAAVEEGHRIRFSWRISDACMPGTGCASWSDPCVKDVRLTYPR